MGRLNQLILLAMLMATPYFWAQQSIEDNKKIQTSTRESVFIHVNASTFVAGELLLFKLYCLNPANNHPSLISKIAYVELVGTDKENVFRQKISLTNGVGQGDFFIPGTLATGNYKLVGYTNWMLNGNSKLFESDIFVINPYQPISGNNPDAPNSVGVVAETNVLPQKTVTPNFSIRLNKKTFKTREKVSFRVQSEIPTDAGHYSVSIRKIADLPKISQQTAQSFADQSKSSAFEIGPATILPELRGEMISGTISSKNSASKIGNIIVALSIPGQSFGLKLVRTNPSGKFIFNLDKNYYQTDIFIQVLDENRNDYAVMLDKTVDYDHSKLVFPSEINLKKNLKNAITERAVASQIENAYYNKKTDSVTTENINSLFFDPLSNDYLLDDYTRFPKMEETIIEIIKEMYFTKENGKYSIHVKDVTAQVQTAQQALVLVDGLIIQDINELFAYDTRNIEKVTIVPGGYYYGASYFDGVVNFVTKSKDFVSKSKGDYLIKADIARPMQRKNYFVADYSNETKSARIPDYRYQLLWQPTFNIDNSETETSFYTSDVTGKFEITVEGFTEKGIPLSLSDVIEIN